jgi:hypothetical protein
MELEALMRIYQVNAYKRKKIELVLIVVFNVFMYLLFGIFCVFELTDLFYFDFNLVARAFRAFLEVILALGMIFSALKLAFTIRKLVYKIPGDIILWLFVGSSSCLLKALEQVIIYFLENEKIDYYWIYSILLCLYTLDDLLPTIIFIKSFKIYPKFMKNNRNDSDSFDRSLDKQLETILGESCKLFD